MSVSESLDNLRAALPECRFAAFVDLEAGMVLSVSAGTDQRQEMLDALADNALALLPVQDGDLSKCLSPGETPASPDVAVLMSGPESLAFVRSPIERAEALCLSCASNADMDDVISGAHATLSDLAKAE